MYTQYKVQCIQHANATRIQLFSSCICNQIPRTCNTENKKAIRTNNAEIPCMMTKQTIHAMHTIHAINAINIFLIQNSLFFSSVTTFNRHFIHMQTRRHTPHSIFKMQCTHMHTCKYINTTHYDQYMYITQSYYALTPKVQILQVGLMFQQ